MKKTKPVSLRVEWRNTYILYTENKKSDKQREKAFLLAWLIAWSAGLFWMRSMSETITSFYPNKWKEHGCYEHLIIEPNTWFREK